MTTAALRLFVQDSRGVLYNCKPLQGAWWECGKCMKEWVRPPSGSRCAECRSKVVVKEVAPGDIITYTLTDDILP